MFTQYAKLSSYLKLEAIKKFPLKESILYRFTYLGNQIN